MNTAEITTGQWLYIYNDDSDIPPETTIGKYLFFCSNKELLVSLGKEIMARYDLPMMKVPSSDKPNNSPGFEFVLAVFDTSDRFIYKIKHFLGDNAQYSDVNYRYFKTNKASKQGKYSDQFKQSSAYGQ